MRGERVNVGIVAIGPNGLDVRFTEIRKLMHLTGHRWEDIAAAYQAMLVKAGVGDLDRLYRPEQNHPELIRGRQLTDSEVFSLSKPGDIRADTPEAYDAAIRKALSVFVDRPTLSRREKQQKINSEISAMLKQVGVLASKGQTIDDGKVIP
ncbi:hypothetical protein AB4144_41725, partial [Rhizobiaceae sp. 2RAB30]